MKQLYETIYSYYLKINNWVLEKSNLIPIINRALQNILTPAYSQNMDPLCKLINPDQKNNFK